MNDCHIEQLAVGIVAFVVIMHLIVWCKLCDRVTRLETLVKLIENEIKLIHEKDGETNEQDN